MPTKLFLLFFGALLLVQCVLANSSEENNQNSSEEKLDREHLEQHVTKLYNRLIDKTFISTRKNFEPVINDVQNNKVTASTRVQEKLNALKELLVRATTTSHDNSNSNTNLNEEKRTHKSNLKELGRLSKQLGQIEHETTNPTDADKSVRRAHDSAKTELNQNLKTFTDRALRDVDSYLTTLSAVEQKAQHNLRDDIREINDESNTARKLELLDKIFIFNGE